MRNSRIYIEDIIVAMKSIEEFVKGIDFEKFTKDDKTSSAVMRKFEIIGEAAKQVPQDIKEKHAEIPWKEMSGMRDKLIHFYFGTDYKLVWATIKERLPKLIPALKNILKEI